MDKKKEDKSVEMAEGFLTHEDFCVKYNTTYTQARPESFLDTVSKEDRADWADFEILSGKNRNGKVNKFNNFGENNKGKSYSTQKLQIAADFKRWKDSALVDDIVSDIYDKMVSQALGGDFKSQQYLLERLQGKIKEEIEIRADMEWRFEHDPTKVIDNG